MLTRVIFIALAALLTTSCGSGDKHLPSSNPSEYDPKKVYSAPSPAPARPTTEPAKPAVSEEPAIALPSLEPGPDEKGEWRKVPMKPESFQQLKGVKTVCDALSQLVQGLGSAQLFAGAEGAALKKSLGSQSESIARSLDRQLFDTFKQQLGPNAAACPSLMPTHKSSNFQDKGDPARIVRTNGQAHGFIQLAQATAPEGGREGYEVSKGSTKLDIPSEYVGWKTREWRTEVGNKPETAGDRNAFVLVNGGKARKCPTPEGVVEGDYEFALVVHQTINDSGTVRTVYNARRVHAILKGQVGDDAKLQYVDLDATLVIGRGGTNAPTSFAHQRQHVRFVPDRRAGGMPSQFSNWSISEWRSELVGTAESHAMGMLLLAVTVFSGPMYLDAEVAWSHENTCVEVTFTPATKTHKLGPNESVPVKTELRTKKEQAVVPAKFKEAKERPREGNGNVSPREDQSQPGTPATFTYTAPATRVRHSGFRVGTVSRAGVAEGEWEAAESSFVLEFDSTITGTKPGVPNISLQSSKAHAHAMIPLQFTEDRGWIGEGTMRYETVPTNPSAKCTMWVSGSGTTTFHVTGGSLSKEGEPFAVTLFIRPGQTVETFDMNCPGVAQRRDPSSFWSAMFNVSRFQRFNYAKNGYEVADWTLVLNSDVMAKKTMRVNCSIGINTCQEETTLILRRMDNPGTGASPPK